MEVVGSGGSGSDGSKRRRCRLELEWQKKKVSMCNTTPKQVEKYFWDVRITFLPNYTRYAHSKRGVEKLGAALTRGYELTTEIVNGCQKMVDIRKNTVFHHQNRHIRVIYNTPLVYIILTRVGKYRFYVGNSNSLVFMASVTCPSVLRSDPYTNGESRREQC